VSNLARAAALIAEAEEEIGTLRHQYDRQRVELQQARNRVQREQDRNRELEDRVADLEVRLEQEKQHAASARAATLAHTARTT
jgi:chromosome segregation ATPase